MVHCFYELVERLVDDFVYMNSCRLREIKKEKKHQDVIQPNYSKSSIYKFVSIMSDCSF